jgi:hypothetical protein
MSDGLFLGERLLVNAIPGGDLFDDDLEGVGLEYYYSEKF